MVGTCQRCCKSIDKCAHKMQYSIELEGRCRGQKHRCPRHSIESRLLLKQEKELPKSMLAAKSFNATSDWRALGRWLAILAEELAARMADDAAQHRRHPRTLVLHYRCLRGQIHVVNRCYILQV